MIEEQENRRRQARKPVESSEKWLYDQALRYLNRFPATTMKMRRHLRAKAAPHAEALEIDATRVEAAIEAVMARLIAAGFINDREYAASKARLMARDGRSVSQIAARLQAMGFSEDDREEAVSALGEDRHALDLKAAAKVVKRRRFGPYRRGDATAAVRDKELASLARQGFSYEIAVRLIDAAEQEEIEAILYGPADEYGDS